ncbi:MAG TPA: helix-turn-helix domain-containing protein [Pyrinomonadaceae bacterium]|nr:helix-turn-helix domain-containing protein [Pyrinomonadaceae bacterium]
MERLDIINPKEAAAYLKITTRTLYRLASSGKIPATKIGGSWRFSRAALEDRVRAQPSMIANERE